MVPRRVGAKDPAGIALKHAAIFAFGALMICSTVKGWLWATAETMQKTTKNTDSFLAVFISGNDTAISHWPLAFSQTTSQPTIG